MSKPKSHPLVDRTEPNLLEETFDYSLPPLIRFDGPMVEYIDGKPVKFDPTTVKTRDIFITDTTFRDGQQARPPYTADQMVRIYDLMAKLGGPHGVIRQTEFFLYTSNDRRTLDRCRELGHRYPECTGWIRANKGDFRLVRDAGLKETGILTSCSDYHIFQKLKFKSRKECMDAVLRGGRCGLCRRRAAPLPPGRRHPRRHRRLHPALLRAADADERAGAGEAHRRRFGSATRWASA